MTDANNVVLEAILKEAVTANYRAKMTALPSEAELLREYPPSAEHTRKMKKLFAEERRKNATKKLLSVAKAAVYIFCVVVTIIFAVLLTNPQVRAAVHDTIVQFFEGFTRIEFAEPQNSPQKKASDYSLAAIPQGYELLSADEYGESFLTVFEDKSGNLLMLTVGPPDSYTVDSNHRSYREQLHGDIQYHIFEADTIGYDSVVIWEQDGYSFALTGILSVDVLLRTAISLT